MFWRKKPRDAAPGEKCRVDNLRHTKLLQEATARMRAALEREARARSWRGEVNRYTVDECS